jgi:hypothetical protein
MGECICSSCINLKSILEDDGQTIEYKCEFGFPSDKCVNCEGDDCSEICSNYKIEEEDAETVTCKGCGKELSKAFKDDSGGEVFCVECYLNK